MRSSVTVTHWSHKPEHSGSTPDSATKGTDSKLQGERFVVGSSPTVRTRADLAQAAEHSYKKCLVIPDSSGVEHCTENAGGIGASPIRGTVIPDSSIGRAGGC